MECLLDTVMVHHLDSKLETEKGSKRVRLMDRLSVQWTGVAREEMKACVIEKDWTKDRMSFQEPPMLYC